MRLLARSFFWRFPILACLSGCFNLIYCVSLTFNGPTFSVLHVLKKKNIAIPKMKIYFWRFNIIKKLPANWHLKLKICNFASQLLMGVFSIFNCYSISFSILITRFSTWTGILVSMLRWFHLKVRQRDLSFQTMINHKLHGI